MNMNHQNFILVLFFLRKLEVGETPVKKHTGHLVEKGLNFVRENLQTGERVFVLQSES